MYRSIQAAVPSRRSSAQALALVVFDKCKQMPACLDGLAPDVRASIDEAMARPEFSAARGEVTSIYRAAPGPERIFLLGLGEKEKFTPEALRVATAKLAKSACAARITQIRLCTLALEGKASVGATARALADGLSLVNFEFAHYKGTANGQQAKPAKPLDLVVEVEPELQAQFRRGLKICESVNLARTLAATPPNVANPRYLVDFCKSMARKVGLRCDVIDARQAAQLGLNGLLAVGAAGSTPPALICLEHKGPKAAGKAPILLVGKAVTFDTGGYSIKPAENMDKMKYDKCGGMAVLGAMHAVASLNLPVHVVGLISAAENMVAANAYRPGDILTMSNGVTVEVTNTDAEGRLVLADAMAYGCKTYQPQAVIDLATLTGGVVVALGTWCAGCFCGDIKLRGHLFDAADFTGERLWHLPLWDEHRQQIKGTHGDIVNSAGREAHPIQGAAFLSYFLPQSASGRDLPWAHLDIAGVADTKSDQAVFAKGPTGYGVRLLVRALETWK